MYKFCQQLKNSIFFANSEIIHCCAGTENLGPRFYSGYKGDIFKAENLINQKKYAQLLAKEGVCAYESCEKCQSWVNGNWDDDNLINDISISHWTACNCNCRYCFTSKKKKSFNTKKPYLLIPVLNRISKIINFNGTVRFIGGDVSMLEEFDEIIDFFIEKGTKNFYIPTSGIEYLKTVENILLKGYGYVLISLDCGNEKMYKKIKRVNCFNQVAKNILKYNENAIKGGSIFELKYIIIPQVNDKIKEIDSWLNFCQDNGIKNIALDFEANYLLKHPDEIPENILEQVDFVETKAMSLGIKVSKFTYLTQLLHGLGNNIYRYSNG